jgi:SAM-dependent methyltransferase
MERSTEIPAIFLQPPLADLFVGCSDIIDVGAYTGENMLWLQVAGWRPVGVEPNPVAANLARVAGLDVRNDYLQNCRFPNASFDAAYLSYVVEHLLDPDAMLSELRRILRPGGKLLLTTHNVHSIWRHIFRQYWINWHMPFHVFHSHPGALTRMVEQAGFRRVALTTRTPAFWLLMSIRAARDTLRFGEPNRHLFAPMTQRAHRGLEVLLRVEDAGFEGDCIIAVFEKAA